jgi:hypothetical protein
MKAANTEIVNALAKTKQPWSPNVGLKENLPITDVYFVLKTYLHRKL